VDGPVLQRRLHFPHRAQVGFASAHVAHLHVGPAARLD
jgi:hypothetical protein